MAFYAVGVLPLIRAMKDQAANGIQMWYADDSSKEGKLENVHAWFEKLKVLGPENRYFPEPKLKLPNKSTLVVAEVNVENGTTICGHGGQTLQQTKDR